MNNSKLLLSIKQLPCVPCEFTLFELSCTVYVLALHQHICNAFVYGAAAHSAIKEAQSFTFSFLLARPIFHTLLKCLYLMY
jgi:hypothetical protein